MTATGDDANQQPDHQARDSPRRRERDMVGSNRLHPYGDTRATRSLIRRDKDNTA
jgi:hypothetical protein